MRGLDVLDCPITKLDLGFIKREISLPFFVNRLLEIKKGTFHLHRSIFYFIVNLFIKLQKLFYRRRFLEVRMKKNHLGTIWEPFRAQSSSGDNSNCSVATDPENLSLMAVILPPKMRNFRSCGWSQFPTFHKVFMKILYVEFPLQIFDDLEDFQDFRRYLKKRQDIGHILEKT